MKKIKLKKLKGKNISIGNVIRTIVSLLMMFGVCWLVTDALRTQEAEVKLFHGNGSYENPYLIQSVSDLALLAETVNAGNTFAGDYFSQTKDLDMKEFGNWTPIGIFDGESCFMGIYDGAGHKIINLLIDGSSLSSTNVGLFGKLGGIVANLGIESGRITGNCIGSIASHAGSDNAIIVNCYNKAELTTTGRAGGIADNFGGGKIICCVNGGMLNGGVTGNITSYSAGTVWGCIATGELVNENFRGSIKQSSIDKSVDRDKVNDRLLEASNLFDLRGVVLRKWIS